jgi:hypothetical protein
VQPDTLQSIAAAERRAAAGLTLLPGNPGERHAAEMRAIDTLEAAYANNTNKKDRGHFEAWRGVCARLGTSPWRIDVSANLGIDREGYREEIFLLVLALVMLYDNMMPRRRSDPAADPRSAVQKLRGVARRHKVHLYPMAPLEYAVLACKGLMRRYISLHGVRGLLPERKLPLTNDMIDAMFALPSGTKRGRLVLDWSTYFWKSAKACFSSKSATGSRKDEDAKERASDPYEKGRMSFGSLIWRFRGVEYDGEYGADFHNLLRGIQLGDGVYMAHGVAKNDPFAYWFGNTPSWLEYHPSGRCPCRDLVALELAAAVPREQRRSTPLFGPAPGEEFTHSQLESAFFLLLAGALLALGYPADKIEEMLSKYSIHSFRIYCACALLAAGCPEWKIMRFIRWRGRASLEIYARLNNDEWDLWQAKMIHATIDSTVVARLDQTECDLSPAVQERANQLAMAMLSLNATTARATLDGAH